MSIRHTIRVTAVILGCGLAAALAQEPPSADDPRAVEVKPAPKVVHTPGAVKIQRRGEGDTVEVSRFDTVNLSVDEMELTDALELLATQSQRNIIPSAKVAFVRLNAPKSD